MSNVLTLWVVYNNPSDFPGQFVARKFEGNKFTKEHFADVELLKVREWIYEQADRIGIWPVRFDRHPSDPAPVYETWI